MADGASMTDDEDIRDAALFRYWCKMASFPDGSPVKVAKALMNCLTADDYRKALTALALEDRINLP